MNFTHTDKLYWPKITKGDLLEYYEKVAKYMLPYLKNRPLVMHRFPNGVKKGGFYQKDVPDAPKFVKTHIVSHANRKVRYIIADNAKTLLYAANLGSIEMHVFNSRIATLDKPDYMVLDLDPTSISFNAVIDVALAIHDFLDQLKISHYCKTSGGSGVHILIPLKGKYSYEETRASARKIGQIIHERLPKITSLERSPSKRKRRVYIDTLQNAKGQLIVAPYSARAFTNAPVSTPLLWKEVKHGIKPEDYTIKNIPFRLAKSGDILKGLLSKSCNLKKV